MKTKIKKIALFLPLLLVGLLVLPFGFVGAADPVTGVWEDWADIEDFIDFALSAVWFIFTIGVMVCFIMAGFNFLTSAGDDTKVAKAKEWVKYGLIGVGVGILAGGMLTLVQNLMSEDGRPSESVTFTTDDVADLDPSGTLSCVITTEDSIKVGYTTNDATDAHLFLGSTSVLDIGSGDDSGSYTEDGLEADTTYTFYLRDGDDVSDDLLDSVSYEIDYVERKDKVTEVVTGITGNLFLDYFLIPLLIASVIFFLFRKQITSYIERIEKGFLKVKEELI
ncbi:MAG: hypothetical protein U9P61_02235 [Patescibacteria group bacterium]|nr:hypothetical protein [Patescibacteria group bacterium]